jgi:hypothetical protein
MVMGFSRKAVAPMRVASTAVSMVAWPLIMITGIVNRAAAGPLLEQGHTIGVGHPDVEQHEVGAQLPAHGSGLCGVFSEFDRVAFVVEDLGEQIPDAQFIVYDQNSCHGSVASLGTCCQLATANDNDTWAPITLPSVMRLLRSTRPPCSSMIFFTTAKPRPVPLTLVVT